LKTLFVLQQICHVFTCPFMLNIFSKKSEKPVPMITFTGEIVQPVRLHYKIQNPAAILKSFDKLQCVKTVELGRCFQWYYEAESKNGAFKTTGNNNPKAPIVLATIFLNAKEKHLSIRTLCKERALYALEFFDKHIRRQDMKVTEMDAYNFIFTDSPENVNTMKNLDLLFPEKDIRIHDPSVFENFMASLIASGITGAAALHATQYFLEEEGRKPLPPIERLPIHFYEDGIPLVKMGLMLRSIVAFEHLNGNTAFRAHDAIERLQGFGG